MALVFPAPSYVNVSVMDVWRGRRVNRWLVDGQHFITWSRGRRGAEMLPSVTSEGENTQITPALSTQMDNIYIPTDPTLTFFSTDIIASYPGRESAAMKTDGQFQVSRDLKIWVEALSSIIYLGLQMLTSLPTKADIPAITFIKRALSAPQQNLLSA